MSGELENVWEGGLEITIRPSNGAGPKACVNTEYGYRNGNRNTELDPKPANSEYGYGYGYGIRSWPKASIIRNTEYGTTPILYEPHH